MLLEVITLLVTIVFFAFVYFYNVHRKIRNDFDSKGVKLAPCFPVFGSFLKSNFGQRHLLEDVIDCYKAFPDERYIAISEGTSAVILIRDPEIVKQVAVQDFDHFTDHREYFSEDVDPLYSGSLLMMTGKVPKRRHFINFNVSEKWRQMRATLSPAFTGSKMKRMVPIMHTVSGNVIDYLQNQITYNGELSEEIDVEDLMTRYSNDVIASTAFGLEVNSLKDRTNEFFITGQKLSNFTFWENVNMTIVSFFPSLAKKLNLKLYPDKTVNFFRNIIKETMEYREKNNIERHDMIQLLMEASKGKLKFESQENHNIGFAAVEESQCKHEQECKKWTPDELAGQAFIFFFAGFESIAAVLIMTVHELALNDEIQKKLYDEIKQVEESNESLTYDVIPQLKYLDMVISETLRKWSPTLTMDRVCVKPYELPPPRPGADPYRVEVGQTVYNPINCIHLDEKYFLDANRFEPERFSEKKKKNIKPYTFMPFGVGPRNCFASRFALVEMKVLLYHLLFNFEIVKYDKTSSPICLKPTDINIRAVGGTWVKLKRRI